MSFSPAPYLLLIIPTILVLIWIIFEGGYNAYGKYSRFFAQQISKWRTVKENPHQNDLWLYAPALHHKEQVSLSIPSRGTESRAAWLWHSPKCSEQNGSASPMKKRLWTWFNFFRWHLCARFSQRTLFYLFFICQHIYNIEHIFLGLYRRWKTYWNIRSWIFASIQP